MDFEDTPHLDEKEELSNTENSEAQESAESIKNEKYHYSPVPSDCMACKLRPKSRRYKELEAKKGNKACEQLSDSSVCYQPETAIREALKRTDLRVVTTNKRLRVFGKWPKDKLLDLLSKRLVQRSAVLPPRSYETIPPDRLTPYHPIVHRGIYCERVLKKLQLSGLSEHQLIRAMKFGLGCLEPTELSYFECFGLTLESLRQKKWSHFLDEALFENLQAIGFNEHASRKIVLHGIVAQNDCYLGRMALAGIDVAGILTWQGPTIEVGRRIIQFLRRIGIHEDVLQLIVQKGIDEESREMLVDLGYAETEEEEHPGMIEITTCDCSLTILESCNSILESSKDMCGYSEASGEGMSYPYASDQSIESRERYTKISNSMLKQPICACHRHQVVRATESMLFAQQTNYLRQTVMIPLAWAMGRALQYRPSDPKHYIAHQLLRWKYGNVSQKEREAVRNFVIAATIKKDEECMEMHQTREDEEQNRLNEEAVRNIPCERCERRQQLLRIKERCWKCIKQWVPKNECQFPEICSSCKTDLSGVLKSDTSTTSESTSAGDVCRSVEIRKQKEEIWSILKEGYREEGEFPVDNRKYPTRATMAQITDQKEEKVLQDGICRPLPWDLPVGVKGQTLCSSKSEDFSYLIGVRPPPPSPASSQEIT